MAQLLNVKPTIISGWELGRNEPSTDTLKGLAHIFNVSVGYVVRDTENQNKDKKSVNLEKDPVVLSYGGCPVSNKDMEVIKTIPERHKNGRGIHCK